MVFRLQRAQQIIALCTIFCISLGIGPAFAALEGPVVEAISYYNLAVDAAANESFDDAMNLIDKSLEIQPDFYLAQITKASLLSQHGEFTQAEDILAQAEHSHPDNPYVLAAKASLFVETGKYEPALKAADAALKLEPSLVEAWIIKGTAHGGLAQFEEEMNASTEALRYDPDNPDAKSNYDFAMKAIRMNQNKNGQEPAEKTPLSAPATLAGVLSAVALVLASRK